MATERWATSREGQNLFAFPASMRNQDQGRSRVAQGPEGFRGRASHHGDGSIHQDLEKKVPLAPVARRAQGCAAIHLRPEQGPFPDDGFQRASNGGGRILAFFGKPTLSEAQAFS